MNYIKLFWYSIERFFITLWCKITAFTAVHCHVSYISICCAILTARAVDSLADELKKETSIAYKVTEQWQVTSKKLLFMYYKTQKASTSNNTKPSE